MISSLMHVLYSLIVSVCSCQKRNHKECSLIFEWNGSDVRKMQHHLYYEYLITDKQSNNQKMFVHVNIIDIMYQRQNIGNI